MVRRCALALSTLLAFVLVGAPAEADTDPGYSVPVATLDAAVHCSGDPVLGPTPVLFLHGTTSNSKANWSWNWNRALDQRGWAWCDVDLPESGNGDIQVAAEYVTRAIRALHARAGRRIDLVGHSQGGMIGRWSLKYWPDTRAMVDDYVGLSSSNHGTKTFPVQCRLLGCSAASWQQQTGSVFLTALNERVEAFPEVDYTEISTRYDEVVVPSTSPYLPAGSNVTNTSVQALCPLELVDHFGMAYDNAAWQIGLDALTHDGPAVMSRIQRRCGNPFMPGVNLATAPTDIAAALLQTARSTAAAPLLRAEPPLKSYAD